MINKEGLIRIVSSTIGNAAERMALIDIINEYAWARDMIAEEAGYDSPLCEASGLRGLLRRALAKPAPRDMPELLIVWRVLDEDYDDEREFVTEHEAIAFIQKGFKENPARNRGFCIRSQEFDFESRWKAACACLQDRLLGLQKAQALPDGMGIAEAHALKLGLAAGRNPFAKEGE